MCCYISRGDDDHIDNQFDFNWDQEEIWQNFVLFLIYISLFLFFSIFIIKTQYYFIKN